MGDFTGLLYARPSFVEGLARTLDLGSTLNEYNASPSGDEADCAAFASDTGALAADFDLAIGALRGQSGHQSNGVEPEKLS